jgi:hypothetical protein
MPLLPDMVLEDIPLRVNRTGIIEFCEQHEAALLGEFSIQIRAEDIDEWHVHAVTLGKQELKGVILEAVCQHFEAEFTQDCHDHVRETLPDLLDDYDAAETLPWRIAEVH